MKFAPKHNKKTLNLSLDKNPTTAISLSQSRTFNPKNSQYRSNFTYSEIQQDPPSIRIEKIENNLSNICNQNEILMPLLKMTSSLPIYSKTETDLKEIKKKLIENEKSCNYFEEGFEKYKEYFEDSKYKLDTILEEKVVDQTQLEKQIKTTNNHLNALHSNLKDVENTVVNLQTLLDKKFNEETKTITETMESKLKKNKKEIETSLKESENRISQIFKENEENLKKFNLFKVFFIYCLL